jgi:hypothetical protein
MFWNLKTAPTEKCLLDIQKLTLELVQRTNKEIVADHINIRLNWLEHKLTFAAVTNPKTVNKIIKEQRALTIVQSFLNEL